jgi:hypothetical protein
MKAVVYKGHTLGLLREGKEFYSVEILHASVLRGAIGTTNLDGLIFPVYPHQYRQATRRDFDDFRVHWHPDYEVSDQ